MPAPTSPLEPPAPRLVCLGNLTLDDVVRPDGSVQPLCIGGDALYGALAARLFLPETEMVAPVGADLPRAVREAIRAAGLSQEGLPERACPTLHNIFAYESDDRRTVTLLSDPADFEALSPRAADVPARFWGADAFVILAMTMAAQRNLAEACRARGGPLVALDLQEEYIAGNEAALRELVALSDVFMPSLDEARALLGHDDARAAAASFASLGPRVVVIKMGADGCLVHDAAGGRTFAMPPCPAPVVDPTGCGDAFCCGFMASFVQAPDDLPRAAACGAVAASFVLPAYGPEGLFAATPARADSRLRAWSPPHRTW